MRGPAGLTMPQRTGRPAGSYGEVAQALVRAAEQAPASVSELCRRAQVGYAVGRYTASRLLARGALVAIDAGRPAVLAAAEAAPQQPCPAIMLLHLWPARTATEAAAADTAVG